MYYMYYVEVIKGYQVVLHLNSNFSNSHVLINLTTRRLKNMGIIKMIRECFRKDELEIFLYGGKVAYVFLIIPTSPSR